MNSLSVYSIFSSVSGEVGLFRQGEFVLFLRLAGCNLRCAYCDTPKTWMVEAGTRMEIIEIYEALSKCGVARKCNRPLRKLIITGGEPLAQDGLSELCRYLYDRGFIIQIETNGSIFPPSDIGEPIVASWVIDYKTLSSGNPTAELHSATKFARTWGSLRGTNFIKYVIGNEDDYREAALMVKFCRIEAPSLRHAFSPMEGGRYPAAALYRSMMADDLVDVILNLQIHKIGKLNEADISIKGEHND